MLLKRRFKKLSSLTLLLLTLTLLLIPQPAQAAGSEMEMKNLDFQIWSEYDEPNVLHILTGTLVNTSGKEYSGSVKFNIPKGADGKMDSIKVNMACELINGTEHSCQPYELTDKGDYAELSWKMTQKLAPGQEFPFWLEYYYNPIQGQPDKTIAFTFRPSYKVNQLKLTFKEPLNSTNFKSTPQPASTGKDNKNFNDYYYNFQQLTPDKPVDFKFSYTRSDTSPSVKKQENPGANEAKPADPLGTSAWKKPEVLIPSILFVVVLVVFIFYAMNNSNKQSSAERIERIQRQNTSKGARSPVSNNPKLAKEKKKIRQMLLNGEISEETYRELIAELEEEYA